ncbi:MAG: sigma-70 family RNA polymerase sigma factor [Firmicutes bacterium]|nr:sigma-70 family RNA polymerase sigma factor [Bacillota bacterium]
MHELQRAVAAYQRGAGAAASEATTVSLIPKLRRLVQHMRDLAPPEVDEEDLLMAGVEAVVAFTNQHPQQTDVPLLMRVARSAIIDEIRRTARMPHALYRKQQQIRRALDQLGPQASEEELAKALHISVATLREWEEACSAYTYSVPADGSQEEAAATAVIDPQRGPDEWVDYQEETASLAEAVARLPEREQLVLALFYQEELTMGEIAQLLTVSKPRVSQLHAQAIARLRAQLTKEADG